LFELLVAVGLATAAGDTVTPATREKPAVFDGILRWTWESCRMALGFDGVSFVRFYDPE